MKASIRKNTLKKGYSYTVFIDYGIVNGSRKREITIILFMLQI